jgi:hypothetical protein
VPRGVSVQFRCGDGNANDATSRIETWEALRQIAGTPGFLYVADSKLCTRENASAYATSNRAGLSGRAESWRGIPFGPPWSSTCLPPDDDLMIYGAVRTART